MCPGVGRAGRHLPPRSDRHPAHTPALNFSPIHTGVALQVQGVRLAAQRAAPAPSEALPAAELLSEALPGQPRTIHHFKEPGGGLLGWA